MNYYGIIFLQYFTSAPRGEYSNNQCFVLKKANKTRAFNIDAYKKHAEVCRTSEHCPLDVKTEVQVEYNHNVERMVVKSQDLKETEMSSMYVMVKSIYIYYKESSQSTSL